MYIIIWSLTCIEVEDELEDEEEADVEDLEEAAEGEAVGVGVADFKEHRFWTKKESEDCHEEVNY